MKRLPTLLLVLVCIAGAFALGRYSAQNRERATGDDSRATQVEVPLSAAAKSEPDGRSVAGGATAQAALIALDREKGSEQQQDERIRLLGLWAARDPQGALNYAKANFHQDRLAQAQTAIMTAWARTAPTAAWEWVAKKNPPETQNLDLVIDEIGKANPLLAAQLVTQFGQQQPGLAQETYLAALQGMSYAGHFSDAQSLIEHLNLSSPDDRAGLVNFLAGQWGRYAPEQAASWVDGLPAGPARDQALASLTESWAQSNPAQAADFAEKLPSGSVRQTALREAISQWVEADPTQARAWVVSANVHEDFDQAVVSISTDTNLMNREPDRALRWASTIFDDQLRIQSFTTILSTLAVQNRPAALSYVQSSPDLSPEQKKTLLTQLAPASP